MSSLDQLLDQTETQGRIERSVTEIIEAAEKDEAIAELRAKMIHLGFTPEVCEALQIEWQYNNVAEAIVNAYGTKVRIFDTSFAGGGWWARRMCDGFDIHYSKSGEKLLNAVMLHLIGIRRSYKERGL